MIASLLAALALAAPPATEEPVPPETPAAAEQKAPQEAPVSIANAVDENGVPAWAKRKRLYPVSSCETKPNIGVETWRQQYDSAAPQRLKPRTATSVCHH